MYMKFWFFFISELYLCGLTILSSQIDMVKRDTRERKDFLSLNSYVNDIDILNATRYSSSALICISFLVTVLRCFPQRFCDMDMIRDGL